MSDNEMLDRVRRIETKLTRFMEGEQSQQKVKITVSEARVDVDSLSVSLYDIFAAMQENKMACASVYDNGKFRCIIELGE